MQCLAVNETSPLQLSWTNMSLIRTGTPMDGSCFFHSIFNAYRSFRELTLEERTKFIARKRAKLADSITISSWLNIQEGSVALVQIMETMQELIAEVSQLESPKISEKIKEHNIDTDILKILLMLLSTKYIEKHIMPKWDNECSKIEKPFDGESFLNRMKSLWYHLHHDNIVKKIDDLEKSRPPPSPLMTSEHKLKVIHKLSSLSYEIFDMVYRTAFYKFKSEIGEYTTWIDIYSFLYILDNMDITANIILLDAITENIFKGMNMITGSIDIEKPFIILLYFPDFHFESIGKIIQADDGIKNVSRIFSADDDIIQHFLRLYAKQ